MTYGHAIRVANCPLKLEVCFPSCFWRKGDKCVFRSKRGRRITELRAKRGPPSGPVLYNTQNF